MTWPIPPNDVKYQQGKADWEQNPGWQANIITKRERVRRALKAFRTLSYLEVMLSHIEIFFKIM